MKTASRFLPPILLFLLAFALFVPSVNYSLVNLDDPVFITNNPIVFGGFSFAALGRAFTSLHGDHAMYSPLLWISYLFDSLCFRASPASPWGYHLSNVLLHAANAVLLFFILKTAVRRPWLAFFAAAFWALHPLRVESVAWVTERKDTLSTLFSLASILFYLKAWKRDLPALDGGSEAKPPSTRHSSLVTRHSRKGLLCFALLAFAAGLLSKPMLVPLPFLFLLLDYWPLRRFTLREASRALPRLALGKWPFFLLAFLFSILTYRLQAGAITAIPLSLRLARIPSNYLFYLARSLWPSGLCPLTPGFPASFPWMVLSCTAFFLLAIVAVLLFRRCPGFLVGLLAFAGLLFPVSGIVVVGDVPVADRYSYLPAFGLSLALLALLGNLLERGRPARPGNPAAKPPPSIRHSSLVSCLCGGIAAAAVLGAEAAVSLRILPSWKDSDALARRTETVLPGHPVVLVHRFNDAFYVQGDAPAALAAANALWARLPGIPYAILAEVLALSQTDSSGAAIAFFESHPVPSDSSDEPSTDSLAIAMAVLYADAGDFSKAESFLETALANSARHPRLVQALDAVAFWIYAAQNRHDRAAAFARRIPAMDADHPLDPANFLLPLTAVWNLGFRSQALPRFFALAASAPDNPALLNNVAWLLATAPNSPAPPGKVLAIARDALEAAPGHPVLRDTFAVALAFNSRFDEAVSVESALADALRGDPDAVKTLAAIESRLALFRARVPFTENADLALLSAI